MKAIKAAALVLSSLVIFFISIEGALWIMGVGTPYQKSAQFNSGVMEMMVLDSYTGIRPKAYYDFGEEKLNSLGLRGDELPENSEVNIVCLGDSTTFGWGLLDKNKTYCSLLGEVLSKKLNKKVATLNGGVPSYTLYQGMQLFYVYLQDLKKWDYAVVSFGWNENPDFELDLEFARLHPPISNNSIRHLYGMAKKLRLFNAMENALLGKYDPQKDPYLKALDQYVSNYRSFLKDLKSNGIKPIVLPVVYHERRGVYGHLRMEIMNSAIRKVAMEEDVIFLNELETIFRKDRGIHWYGQSHFGENGHRIITEKLTGYF